MENVKKAGHAYKRIHKLQMAAIGLVEQHESSQKFLL